MNLKTIIQKSIPLVFLILLVGVLSSRSILSNTVITFLDADKNPDNTDNYDGIRLLQFFLPFCPGCIAEADVLEQISQNYNVTLFGLNVNRDDPKEILLDFKANHSLSDEWIFGFSTLETERMFDIRRVPTLVILDDLGNIVDGVIGSVDYSYIETRIQYAINHMTESYNTEFYPDPKPITVAIFIIVGTTVGVLVLYFLVMSFFRSRKDALIASAMKKLSDEEMKKED
jgi:thiol-disulfide isomerase/thioredoxin